jgi:hypothetical protein
MLKLIARLAEHEPVCVLDGRDSPESPKSTIKVRGQAGAGEHFDWLEIA